MSDISRAIVWNHYPEGGSKLIVLLAMADKTNEEGESAYEAVGTIARKCRLGSRQVQKILRQLEAEKMIEAVAFQNGGRGHTTHYKINLDYLETFPALVKIKKVNADSSFKEEAKGEPQFAFSAQRVNTDSQNGPERANSSSPEYINTNNKNNNSTRADSDVEKKAKRGEFHFDKKVPFPDNFYLTDALRKWSVDSGYDLKDVEDFCEDFINRNQATDQYHYADWEAAFKSWYRQELKRRKEIKPAANRQASNQQRQTYKSRKEQAKEEFDAFRDELYRSAKQPIIQPQPERDPNTRDVFDAEWTVIDGADEDPPCPF